MAYRASDLTRLRVKLGPPARIQARAQRYTALMNVICDRHGLPRPTPEFKFHETRKWRADFCWVPDRVALEIDGAIWTQGRHTRGSGYLKDMEKRRAYAAAGILLVPITPADLATAIWVDSVREAMRWSRVKGTP